VAGRRLFCEAIRGALGFCLKTKIELAIAVVVPLTIIALIISGPILYTQIAEKLTWFTCGLFVETGGYPIPNLAVQISSDHNFFYSTDSKGFTRIGSTGYTNGCPAGLDGLLIAASVEYRSTQYSIYLAHNANVTLEVA
jgi:hypothetical protein